MGRVFFQALPGMRKEVSHLFVLLSFFGILVKVKLNHFKRKLKMKEESIHIGHIIRNKLKESQITVVEFSAKLNCNRTNVYNIFNRPSIDTDLLLRISKILQYDFFKLYSQQ